MKFTTRHYHERGLTLLELLVVLTILAVLSTVAITSSSGVADQARYEATQRTLENIHDAVLGPVNQRDADGTGVITGFLADMGRLPQATAETLDDGSTVFTLKELWTNVNGLPPHSVVQAVGSNVNDASLADSNVYITAGWRGPYLNLSAGNTLLRDGWGAILASPNGTVASVPYALLMTSDGSAISAAGQAIGQVNSFGANGKQNSADTGYNTDFSVSFSSQSSATVAVTVNIFKSNGDPAVTVPADEISVRLFGTNPATGLILVTNQTQSFASNTLSFAALPATTPGQRVLRAYYSGSITTSSAVTPVMLRAGGNIHTLILTLPP